MRPIMSPAERLAIPVVLYPISQPTKEIEICKSLKPQTKRQIVDQVSELRYRSRKKQLLSNAEMQVVYMPSHYMALPP